MRTFCTLLCLLVATYASCQERPYGATWLCNQQNQIVGSILNGNIYDTQGNPKYTLRQGQTYSTQVGKYGGAPLGASQCRQLEMFDTMGRGCGCAEGGWGTTVISTYDGQQIWRTCQ